MVHSSNSHIFFFANFFASVSNGPAKFALLLHRLDKGKGQIRIVTEDVPDPVPEGVTAVARRPKYLKTTYLTQLFRSRQYHDTVRKIGVPPSVPLIFNNIISGTACARRLPNPVVGFINDYNNLPGGRPEKSFSKRLNMRLMRRAEQRAARLADVVVVNSNFMKEKITAAYGIDENKVKILYKGLNTSFAVPPLRRIDPQQKIKILFVKSDFTRGGLSDLIEAIRLLPDTVKTELKVIGPAKKDYLRVTGQKEEEVDYVEWLGRQNQEFVHKMMAEAHIFCVPAYSEALGVANMEAIMHNCRLICTPVGGIPEVTNSGENCTEVPVGSPQAIADAVMRLYKEPFTITEKRAEAARRFVIDRFDEQKAYRRLLEIVNEIES